MPSAPKKGLPEKPRQAANHIFTSLPVKG